MKENKHRSLCITQECPIVNPVTFYSLSFPKRTCKKERTRCNMSLLHVIKYGFVWKWRQSLLGLVYLPWLHYHIKFDIHTSCWFCTETILAQVRILCLWKKTQILHSLWELLKENQFYARKYSFLRMMNPEGYHMYNYWCLYLFIIDCLKRKGIQCLKLDNNIQLYLW